MNEIAHNIAAIDFPDTTVNIAIITWRDANFSFFHQKHGTNWLSFDPSTCIKLKNNTFYSLRQENEYFVLDMETVNCA